MSIPLLLILALAFLTGALLALAVMGLLGAERAAVARRLDGLAQPAAPAGPLPSLADAELEGGWRERLWQPALKRLARMGARLTPAGASDRLRASLARAGNPAGLGAREFGGLRVVSALACLCLAVPVCVFVPLLQARLMLLGLAALIGLALPETLLEQAIRRRQALIRRALPDAIDLLVVSVEAGMGLDGAMAKVTEKMRGPLSEELTRARHEMRLGKTRGQALRDMAARLDMGEVKTFVAAIYQADQLGTSIARVLRAQSQMARAARVQRVREQAARLPVTMLFPLVLFIFPAIFVVLLGPSVMRLMTALGHMN
jgi:tight adherence protein C